LTPKTPRGRGDTGPSTGRGGPLRGVYRGVLMVIQKGDPLWCYMGKILTMGMWINRFGDME